MTVEIPRRFTIGDRVQCDDAGCCHTTGCRMRYGPNGWIPEPGNHRHSFIGVVVANAATRGGSRWVNAPPYYLVEGEPGQMVFSECELHLI